MSAFSKRVIISTLSLILISVPHLSPLSWAVKGNQNRSALQENRYKAQQRGQETKVKSQKIKSQKTQARQGSFDLPAYYEPEQFLNWMSELRVDSPLKIVLVSLLFSSMLGQGSAQSTSMNEASSNALAPPTGDPCLAKNNISPLGSALQPIANALSGRDVAGTDSLKKEVAQLGMVLSKDENGNFECPKTAPKAWCEEVESHDFSIEGFLDRMGKLMDEALEVVEQSDSKGTHALAGNKHKNIIKMEALARILDIPELTVLRSQGIHGSDVEIFLKQEAPEVFQHWKKLGELYANHKDSTPFTQTSGAQSELQGIQIAIKKAFQSGKFPITEGMLSWLSDMWKSGNSLIVRSSGAEDSKKVTNAGGNLSISYVYPKSEQLTSAIGKVIASYFSSGSLENRIRAHENPFTEKLNLSVAVQEIIGETIGRGGSKTEDIPISLVLFSSEPLYVGNEKFRAMRVSATYGHGEGVVGNQGIGTDTALILQSSVHPDQLYVLYENQEKAERLAPLMFGTLQKVANPIGIRHKPALSPSLLRRLFQWGVVTESFFGQHPTDLEIVVKNNVIYPVQARPINRPKLLPTYLDQKKIQQAQASPVVKVEKATVLVPGRGSVLEIQDPHSVLVTETLQEAERSYIPGKHRLVVVHQEEPSNSHPVVNFASLGQPCLYTKNKEQIKDLLHQMTAAKRSLAVSMQDGSLHLWDSSKGVIKDFVSEGFIVHPAKIALSLPIDQDEKMSNPDVKNVPQEIQDLLRDIREVTDSRKALSDLLKLRQHPWVKNLAEQRKKLARAVQEDQFQSQELKRALQIAEFLEKAVNQAFDESIATQKSAPENHRLERLLKLKVLESLLVKPPQDVEGGLNYFSVNSFDSIFEDAMQLARYQSELNHSAHFNSILNLGREAPFEGIQEHWTKFLFNLEKVVSAQEAEQLKKLVSDLREYKVLPNWMATFFEKEYQQGTPPKEILTKAIQSFTRADEKMISKLHERQKSIRNIQKNSEAFGNPETFDQSFSDLKTEWSRLVPDRWLTFSTDDYFWNKEMESSFEILSSVAIQIQDYLAGNSIYADWNSVGSTTRNLVAQTLEELVEASDHAIKAMKSSPQMADSEKLAKFHSMVTQFHEFFLKWMDYLPGAYELAAGQYPNEKSWRNPHPFAPMALRRKETTEWLSKKASNLNKEDLLPGPRFSLQGSMIGNQKYGSVKGSPFFPETLEDLFTLVHQNLLYVTSVLRERTTPASTLQSVLPKKLVELNTGFTRSYGRDIVLTRMDFTRDGCAVHYQKALGQHGIQYELICDRRGENCTFKMNLTGINEGNRWGDSEAFLKRLQTLDIFPGLGRISSGQNGVSASLSVNTLETMDIFDHIIEKLARPYNADPFGAASIVVRHFPKVKDQEKFLSGD